MNSDVALDDFDSKINMEKIRALTDGLVAHPLIDVTTLVGDKVVYDCPSGSCKGLCLLNMPGVAVQLAEAEAGTIFPAHTHSDGAVEYLIVIDGELVHEIDGRTVSASTGGFLFVHAGASHSVIAVAKTRMIGITIPRSEGYPNAK
jgi:quercetin dioxygenase-like cupin family protein